MKLTIVPQDKLVIVDGYGIQGIDLTSIPAEVHAVQWNETTGWVEYVGEESNEPIASIDIYMDIVNDHINKKNSIENPTYTIDQIKQIQKNLINSSFLAAPEQGLMTSLGYKVNATRIDKSNVEELLDYCQRNNIPGTNQFRIYDNSFVNASLVDLQIIINEIQEFGLSLYNRKWAKEAAIDTSVDEDSILAITWDSIE